ncbi:MAG: HAD family hydrolase [Acutalibacteraceae bacterium]
MNVYDFDETIYDGESSVEFILMYLKKDPKIITFLPTVFKVIIQYNRGKISFDDFVGKYANQLKKYFENNNVDLQSLVSKFWDKHMHKIKPFYKELQKEDDVILTASPEFMMRDICDRLGIKHLVSTDFDIKTGEIKKACFREGKIDCFKEAFPDGIIDNFYTDSLNDQFMFPFAKHVFMVKKNKIEQIK